VLGKQSPSASFFGERLYRVRVRHCGNDSQLTFSQ
jgi:hypothetical protein